MRDFNSIIQHTEIPENYDLTVMEFNSLIELCKNQDYKDTIYNIFKCGFAIGQESKIK